MFITFHELTENGVGTLNSNMDGSPKSIVFGGELRNRVSSQKRRFSYREGLKIMGYECCIQTRGLLEILTPIAKRKKESNDVLAETFCKDLLLNFLKHKEKKDSKEDEEGKEEKEKEASKKFEIARFAQVEVDLLKDYAKERASGKDIDPKEVDFKPFLKDMLEKMQFEIDLLLFGRMRPSPIVGCWKVQTAIGVTRSNEEKDLFIASDDLVKSGTVKKGGAVGHLNDKGKWVSSSINYGYSVLNVDQLLAYYKGDKERASRTIQAIFDIIRKHAPKSDSVGSPNQGVVTYIMVEKLEESPISMELAFNNTLQNRDEAVATLRKFKKSIDQFYERGNNKAGKWETASIETGLPGIISGVSTPDEVKKFLKI